MSFIELHDLCKDYVTVAGKYAALKHINLSIAPGEFVALMGPSGSGKSTLMNILGCLDVPSGGRYMLADVDVGLLDNDGLAKLRNSTIGFIFQGFNLLSRATLLNNVALPLVYAGSSRGKRQERARAMLQKVGLAHRVAAMPNEISGGEQQRVAIARALVNNPKLILADEPTGNLDSTNSKIIMELFTKLNGEGITIFLVTHDAEVASYARRLVKLRDGSVVFDQIKKRSFLTGGMGRL